MFTALLTSTSVFEREGHISLGSSPGRDQYGNSALRLQNKEIKKITLLNTRF